MERLLKRTLPYPIFQALRNCKKSIQRLNFKGDSVYCACCGSSFSAFAPFGIPRRPNRICLQCDSLERDRLLWMFLEKETDLFTKTCKLLHVAPERVFFNRFKCIGSIDYYPVDKYPREYPSGTKRLDLLHHSMPDHSFDVIICNHVFQYIIEDRQAIKSVYDMLKPGGWAILQVPMDWAREVSYEDYTIASPQERERVYGLSEHVRWYGRDYASRLEEAGFRVKMHDFIDRFSPEERRKYGFWEGEKIFYCVKPGR
jgi:SAM-dependent methyltransferase